MRAIREKRVEVVFVDGIHESRVHTYIVVLFFIEALRVNLEAFTGVLSFSVVLTIYGEPRHVRKQIVYTSGC